MKNKLKGFTLIEIMIVIVILGILASLIIPNIIGRPDEAKIIKAKQDILAIENALEMYRLDNGFYPSTDQGLAALTDKPSTEPVPNNWKEGGYLKQLRKDPWDRSYQYLFPGTHGEIDVFSLGRDGKLGGEKVDADIGNWDVQKPAQ
jgi:general secretion pathway protein G